MVYRCPADCVCLKWQCGYAEEQFKYSLMYSSRKRCFLLSHVSFWVFLLYPRSWSKSHYGGHLKPEPREDKVGGSPNYTKDLGIGWPIPHGGQLRISSHNLNWVSFCLFSCHCKVSWFVALDSLLCPSLYIVILSLNLVSDWGQYSMLFVFRGREIACG